MDADKRKVLLVWLNCLDVGPQLKKISQLSDGQHISEILRIIWISNPKHTEINPSNWTVFLQHFLEDFYRCDLSNVIKFEEFGTSSADEFELSKAALLLLCASIHFSGDQRFVDRLIVLEQCDQLLIKSLVESVYFTSLQNGDFASVLARSETPESFDMKCAAVNGRPSSPTNSEIDFVVQYNADTPASPIRQLMQSPQMQLKLGLRDRERKIKALELELDSERSLKIEIELELEKMKLQLEGREICIKTLARQSDELQIRCLEVEKELQSTRTQLECCKAKMQESDNLLQELKLLNIERENLVKEKLELEAKVDRLQSAYRSCERRSRELGDTRDMLCSLQAEASEKDTQIGELQSALLELRSELIEERQLNADKTKTHHDSDVDEPESPRNAVSIVTEVVGALEVQLREVQSLNIDLLNEKETLESHLQTKKDLVEHLERELLVRDGTIEDKKCAVQQLMEQLAKLEYEKVQFEKVVQESVEEQNHFKALLQNAAEEKSRLLQDVQNSLVDLSLLRAEVASKTIEFDSVLDVHKQQLCSLQSLKCQLEYEKQSLESDCQIKDRRIGQLEEDVRIKDATIHDMHKEELRRKDELDKRLRQIEEDKTTIESELQRILCVKNELANELQAKSELVEQLQNAVHSKDSLIEEQTMKATTVTEKLDGLLREKDRLDDVVLALEADVNLKLKEIVVLREETARQTVELSDVPLLRAEIASKNKELEVASVREHELRSLQSLRSQLECEKQSLVSDCLTKDRRIDQLEDDVRIRDATILEQQSEVLLQKGELDRCLRQMDEDKIRLESELQSVLSMKNELVAELQTKTLLIAQVEDALLAKNNALEEEMKNTKNLTERMNELLLEKDRLDGCVWTLETNLSDQLKVVAELQDEALRRTTKLVELEQKLAHQDVSSKETVAAQQLYMERLKAQVEELSVTTKDLEVQLEDRDKAIDVLKEEMCRKDNKNFGYRMSMAQDIEALQRVVDEQRVALLQQQEQRPQQLQTLDSATPASSPVVVSFNGDASRHSVTSDIEKSRRRRSSDLYCGASFLNHSPAIMELVDESPRRFSLVTSGSIVSKQSFDETTENAQRPNDDDVMLNDSLDVDDDDDGIIVKVPFGSKESLPNEREQVIATLTEQLDALSLHLKEKEANFELMKSHTQDLVKDNRRLESEVNDLRKRLDEQTVFAKVHQDLSGVVHDLKRKVVESEQKSVAALKACKEENDYLKTQFDLAKRTVQEANNGRKDLEVMLAQSNQQLEEYKAYVDSKKRHLAECIALLKQEKDTVHFLRSRLQEEEKKMAPYVEKVREQEMTISRQVAEKRSLETQLDLASQKLRELQKTSEVDQRRSQSSMVYAAPRMDRVSTASLSSMKSGSTSDAYGSRQSIFENIVSTRGLSTQDLDGRVWRSGSATTDTSIVSNQRAVPVGVGNYFMCEDEEGEFHNVSYLHDLKHGTCEVDHPLQRISELQRRNTLCRPHLKTCYPVETQMHVEENFTDDDLKAGTAVAMDLMNEPSPPRFKTKPITSNYHKPGPPTPGKTIQPDIGDVTSTSTMSTTSSKLLKTPASIRKLIKRTVMLGTPKQQYRVTPKKNGNMENVPPTERAAKAATVRKNIAFQIGLSPKVKSEPQSLTAPVKSKEAANRKPLKLAVFNRQSGKEQPQASLIV